MVKVSSGKFKSGSDKKTVSVKSFKIDKFEVTFAEYNKFDKTTEIPEGKGDHPVAEVNYFNAEKYCKSVNKRLPTAVEWEKAARGKKGLEFPWGDSFDSEKANTQESEIGGTTPVGSYKAGKSPYGAMDMSGNVFEWVDAWAGDDKKYRIMMGGSYFDDQYHSTTYATLKSIPDDMHLYIGFRCAK